MACQKQVCLKTKCMSRECVTLAPESGIKRTRIVSELMEVENVSDKARRSGFRDP